jgi:hypothetical protein
MYGTGADPHHPNLRLGKAGSQSVARLEFIRIHLVAGGLNIDGRKLACVFSLEMATDVVFVNRVAALGEFFFAVEAFNDWHVSIIRLARPPASFLFPAMRNPVIASP